MKKFFEKYIYIILIVLTILFTTFVTFSYRTDNNDGLWNFANTYKMYNGGIIYNDNNVIITPLFFDIGLIIFKILGVNLFVFGIYNILIWTVWIILVFKLFLTLEMKKTTAWIMSIIILFSQFQIIAGGANYNVLVMVFVTLRYNFSH